MRPCPSAAGVLSSPQPHIFFSLKYSIAPTEQHLILSCGRAALSRGCTVACIGTLRPPPHPDNASPEELKAHCCQQISICQQRTVASGQSVEALPSVRRAYRIIPLPNQWAVVVELSRLAPSAILSWRRLSGSRRKTDTSFHGAPPRPTAPTHTASGLSVCSNKSAACAPPPETAPTHTASGLCACSNKSAACGAPPKTAPTPHCVWAQRLQQQIGRMRRSPQLQPHTASGPDGFACGAPRSCKKTRTATQSPRPKRTSSSSGTSRTCRRPPRRCSTSRACRTRCSRISYCSTRAWRRCSRRCPQGSSREREIPHASLPMGHFARVHVHIGSTASLRLETARSIDSTACNKHHGGPCCAVALLHCASCDDVWLQLGVYRS
eukprot:363926-Chlamydomonas_euryale.AAC.3